MRKKNQKKIGRDSIFISYARKDSRFAHSLFDRLEHDGLDVYWDADSIVAGESFQQAISEAIKKSTVVLCIFSEAYKNSAWCNQEINLAMAYGRPVIPILMDDTEIEGPLYYLNGLDLRHFENMPKNQRNKKIATLREAITALSKRKEETQSFLRDTEIGKNSNREDGGSA